MDSNKIFRGKVEIGHFMLYFLNLKAYYLFNEAKKAGKTLKAPRWARPKRRREDERDDHNIRQNLPDQR